MVKLADIKHLQTDPSAFRDALKIDADGRTVRLGRVLDTWQRDDFEMLDPGWLDVVGRGDGQGTKRAYLERPRGHSKTADLAVMATWCLFSSKRRISGYAAAADRDQARLLRDTIEHLVRLNPWLGSILTVQQYKVSNEHTGSTLDILSSDAPTSYGIRPDFVVADELTHWTRRDLWDSLLSSAAKRAACMLVVISNAGFQDTWVWDVRENARTDASWFFSRLEKPVASWISQDRLDEQRRLLPLVAYRRLWLNEWTSGSGDALAEEDIQAAVRSEGPLTDAQPGWRYVAGVDLGLTRDASAVVVVGRHVGRVESHRKPTKLSSTAEAMVAAGLWDQPEPEHIDRIEEPTGRLKVAQVRVWKPDGGRVSIEGIEKTLLRLFERFGLACVGFDPWQAAMLRERLDRAGVPTAEVPFTGTNLTSMCSAVLEAFHEGTIDLYDDQRLLADLANLRVVEKSYGVRLDSPRGLSGHGDVATALAIALHTLQQETGQIGVEQHVSGRMMVM